MGYGQLPYTLSRDASRLGGEGQRGEARRSFTRSLRVPRGPDSPYVFIERIYPAAAKNAGIGVSGGSAEGREDTREEKAPMGERERERERMYWRSRDRGDKRWRKVFRFVWTERRAHLSTGVTNRA
jgi:hypothetical protein